jgi:hypothetical protein
MLSYKKMFRYKTLKYENRQNLEIFKFENCSNLKIYSNFKIVQDSKLFIFTKKLRNQKIKEKRKKRIRKRKNK